jgi:hypothetical protein
VCKLWFGKNFDLEKFQNHDTRCDACEHIYTTQLNINRLKDVHTFTDDHMKFHGNLETQVENWLIVENFSTFSVENLDSTCTAHFQHSVQYGHTYSPRYN